MDGGRPEECTVDGAGAALDAVFVISAAPELDAASVLYRRLAAEYGLTPEEVSVAIELARQEALVWEIEHPGLRWADSCDCMCPTVHPGRSVCTQDADELVPKLSDGTSRSAKRCASCAQEARWSPSA